MPALPAHAQQDDDAVVVTATRFPERRLDAPVGMTIITARDIARDTARTLPEVLTHLGGLYARNNSGSPDLQLDLRGFGITGDQNTLVLLDGVRLNENDLSSTKLSAIPLQSIARIEILRGSGSVLYGGGAAGGTINIVTKSPQAGHDGASAFAGAGSYGTADARASLSRAGERFGALVSASHFESDNYRLNNRVRQDNVTGDVRFTGADGELALKFGADAQRLRLPGVRDQNQLASDPRGTDTPHDWSARDGNFATLLGSRRLGSVELAADLGYRDQLSSANYVSLASYNEARLRSLSFAPRLRWTSDAAIPTSLVLGVDLSRWDFERAFAADPASIASPNSSTTASQDNSAFYAQASAQLAPAAETHPGRARAKGDDAPRASRVLRQRPAADPQPARRRARGPARAQRTLDRLRPARHQLSRRDGGRRRLHRQRRAARAADRAPARRGAGVPRRAPAAARQRLRDRSRQRDLLQPDRGPVRRQYQPFADAAHRLRAVRRGARIAASGALGQPGAAKREIRDAALTAGST